MGAEDRTLVRERVAENLYRTHFSDLYLNKLLKTLYISFSLLLRHVKSEQNVLKFCLYCDEMWDSSV